MGPPMRSSIACQRCRRSKIKCENQGAHAACETCIKSGQECRYPEVTTPAKRQPALATKRPDAPESGRQERDLGPERKRKKLEDISNWLDQRSSMYTEEVLNYPFLRGEIWDQIFNIFQTHFSTELPFLHFPTLQEKINRRHKDSPADRDLSLVSLGILTLTARFHPDLPKYVAAIDPSLVGSSPGGALRGRTGSNLSPADPNAASEFYAKALTTALGMVDGAVAKVNVERIQAYLMLGLHEWTRQVQGSGMAAWMYVGIAIRMAQALVLGREEVPFDNGESDQDSPEEVRMVKEMRRRTMFSCLVMDRLLAVGPRRVSAVRSADLRPIKLPCSETDFSESNETETGFLDQQTAGSAGDSLLGRFVRLVDFWGDVTKYSFEGGRRRGGECPPWEHRSRFKELRAQLDEFYSSLPNTFVLSSKNFYRHTRNPANTGIFVSLHMLGAICQIMMHREFLPFLAVRCQRPNGPLDPPHLPEAPPGFWGESAEHVFRAARDITDLIQLSGDRLPHSALVLFAVWMAAFVGLYALSFPHMDQHDHMHTPEELKAWQERRGDVSQVEGSATALTVATLQKMKTFLPAAENYLQKFEEINLYFHTVRSDEYHKNVQGGGLNEWKASRGASITSNGQIHPTDYSGKATLESHEGAGGGGGGGGGASRSSTQDKASPSGTDTFSSVSVATPRSTTASSFTPINTLASAHHQHYPQQQQQQFMNQDENTGGFSPMNPHLYFPPAPVSFNFFPGSSGPHLQPGDGGGPSGGGGGGGGGGGNGGDGGGGSGGHHFVYAEHRDPAKAEVMLHRLFTADSLGAFIGDEALSVDHLAGIPMSVLDAAAAAGPAFHDTDHQALAANAVSTLERSQLQH